MTPVRSIASAKDRTPLTWATPAVTAETESEEATASRLKIPTSQTRVTARVRRCAMTLTRVTSHSRIASAATRASTMAYNASRKRSTTSRSGPAINDSE